MCLSNETPLQGLKRFLKALKSIGVVGIYVSIWWGIVENMAPGAYDWEAYQTLLQLIKDFRFQIKVWFILAGTAAGFLSET